MSTTENASSSFEENFKKLESLSEELQKNSVSIDQLVPKMKEAVQAIKVCKTVLKKTSSQLVEIEKEFSDLQKEDSSED